MNLFSIFKKKNPWIAIEKQLPPKKMIWGKNEHWYGLIIPLEDGTFIWGAQRADQTPYPRIKITHWKEKL